MRFIKYVFFYSLVVLGAVTTCWADDDVPEVTAADARSLSNPDWQATVDKISAQTKELLTANEKLSSEYEFLQGRVKGLKSDLEKTKAEIKDLKAKKKITGQPVAVGDSSADDMAKMADLQKQIDDIGSQNKDFEKQLGDIQEKNRLWKIQVAELENKKRDANLDVQYKEAKDKENDSAVKAGRSALQAQLDKSLQNEKDLMEALDKMSAQNDSLPKETANLKKKNRDLEDHVKLLKKQIADQKLQNDKLKKSTQKIKAAPKGASADLLKQKKALEAEVAKLNSQIDAVSKTVGESKEVLEKKRQLMDQIMHLDADNQELRSKINALGTSGPSN